MKYLLILISCLLSFSLLAETKVGVLLPLSGKVMEQGQGFRAQINSLGDNNLTFHFADEKCEEDLAITALEELASKSANKFIIGPFCLASQKAITPYLPNNDSLAIIGGSTSRQALKRSLGRMLATQPSIETEASFNAEKIFLAGHQRVVIVSNGEDASQIHEEVFKAQFKGQVVETIIYNLNNILGLKAIVALIRKHNPDALYLPDAFALEQGIMRHIRNVGLKNLEVFTIYSSATPQVITASSRNGEGLMVSYPQIGNEEVSKYYANLNVQILQQGIKACPQQEFNCVSKSIRQSFPFDKDGLLPEKLGLKFLSYGKWEWYQP